MKPHIFRVLLIVAAIYVRFTLAQTICNADTSINLDDVGSSSSASNTTTSGASSNGSSVASGDDCNGDPSCESLLLDGEISSSDLISGNIEVAGQSGDDLAGDDPIDGKVKRQSSSDFTCSSS